MANSAESLLVSAYEAARLENIKKNAEMLQALGLNLNPTTNDNKSLKRKSTPSNQVKEPKKKQSTPTEPTRRSSRLQNIPAPNIDGHEHLPQSGNGGNTKDEDFDFDSHHARLMELKIERLRQLHKENTTSYNNPTATYEHTWMRIRTMTDKALLNRVRAIERALGQHCIVKMRMFAEVLILAGKDELAQSAKDSLERLLALVDAKDKSSGKKVIQNKVEKMIKPSAQVESIDEDETKLCTSDEITVEEKHSTKDNEIAGDETTSKTQSD